MAHVWAEVYNMRAKEIRSRRAVKEEMLEMGEELKHSTFEERRDMNVNDVLMYNLQRYLFKCFCELRAQVAQVMAFGCDEKIIPAFKTKNPK